VEKDVHQVVPAGIETEELDVQHVGKPCQGMPVVAAVGRRKSPHQIFKSQSFLNVWIFRDVGGIVEVDKCVSPHLPVNGGGDEHKEKGDEQSFTFVGCMSHGTPHYPVTVNFSFPGKVLSPARHGPL
jgi:hypothetical protein